MGCGADFDKRPDEVSEPMVGEHVVLSTKGDCTDLCEKCCTVKKTECHTGTLVESSSVYNNCTESEDPCVNSSCDKGSTRGCSDTCHIEITMSFA